MDYFQFVLLGGKAKDGDHLVVLSALANDMTLVTRAHSASGSGETLLHDACEGRQSKENDGSLVSELLKRGAVLSQRDLHGKDALMFASSGGHVTVIDILISHGADLHARNNNGDCALALAAQNGKLRACKFLIAKGSNLWNTNNQDKTAKDLFRIGASDCDL